MKTLDGFLKVVKTNGEVVEVSSRCAEMDREMVSLLGVSKAVLDNVIFCHQEESNWPLSESLALKKKFDDIFASTRYVKALDAIRKFRTEQSVVIKEFQAEIKYLKQNKEKAGEIRSDLADRESRHGVAKSNVTKVQEALEPVLAKLGKLKEQEEKISQIKNTVDKLKGEKSQMEKAQHDLRRNIKNEFKESTEELQQKIEEFTGKVSDLARTLDQNKDKLSSVERELAKMEADRTKSLGEQGRLQSEAERHDRIVKSRNLKAGAVIKEYKFKDLASSGVNDEVILEMISRLEEEAKKTLARANEQKTEYEGRANELQKKIDARRSSKTKLETEQQLKRERQKKNSNDIKNINIQLSHVDASAGRLNDIGRDISQAELMCDEAEKSVDLDALQTEIVQLQREKQTMDARLKQLDVELNTLTQEATVRTQLELFCKDKTTKEDQIRRLMSKNEDTLKHVLGALPTDSFHKALDKYLRDHSRRLVSGREALQQMQKKLTTFETTRRMEKDALSHKQEELRVFLQQINDVTQGLDFDDTIAAIENKLKGHHDGKGHLTAIDFLFRKYIDKLQTADPCCPLCHRPFDEAAEVAELVQEMETKLSAVPAKLDILVSQIEQEKNEYDSLLQLKPKRDMVKDRKDRDIPQLETRIETLTKEIQKLQTDISEKEEEVDVDSNDESVAKSLQPDAMQIDRLQTELADLNRRIEMQTSKLSATITKTLQEVQKQRGDLQLELEQTNLKLEHKRETQRHQTDKLMKLRSELTSFREERVQIERDLQKRVQLEDTKRDLVATNDLLETEIMEAIAQVQPLKDEIDNLIEEKEEISRVRDQKYEEANLQSTKVKDVAKNLRAFQDDVERYKRDGCEEKLAAIQVKMTDITTKNTDLENKKSNLTGSITQINKDLASQQIYKRELDDNMLLRRRQEDIEGASEKIRAEEGKLGGFNPTNLAQEKRELEREYERLQKDKDAAKSRMTHLEGEIVNLSRDLKIDQYREADVKYKAKRIALRTTELANSDLEKYYKALDGTIMAYHNQKMTEINKIICELWRNTYRGNDIETIEIRSDVEEESGTAASKIRRQYKYRVIMMKAGAELDMRGRCSAGQKVLACLIIRLALAETFCLNCGVLALDEPTTNLDRENIESLAFALDKIIQDRSKQRNFQLIVITHDEDFLELLGRSEHADDYFRVSKRDDGCSKLAKVSLQGLHEKS